jgi:FAD/FMN-containing dehydrogenase
MAELPLTVRAGGHSPAGMSSSDGVVIDLRSMHAVRVDPAARVAVVAAGAMWGVVDAATQRFGFAVPGVPVSHVGVAGSTLGGGFGHLRRAYGLACDNLLAADLITADGRNITASGDLHPELLWGLRGAGGNFGVVTSMRFRLHPLPEPVLSGPVVFAAEHAAALLRFYRDYTAKLREDVTTRLGMHGAATRPLSGPAGRLPIVAITAACVGHPADAERLVRPIRHAAPVLADRLAPQPYTRLQASADDAYPPGRCAAITSYYVDDLDDALVTALCDVHAAMPVGAHEVHVHHMGGAVAKIARMSTAVPNRGARYLITMAARWDGPEQDPASHTWFEQSARLLRPFSVGGPHVGLESGTASSVTTYGAERYLRLAALKRRFDPDNVFIGNQNVMPLT